MSSTAFLSQSLSLYGLTNTGQSISHGGNTFDLDPSESFVATRTLKEENGGTVKQVSVYSVNARLAKEIPCLKPVAGTGESTFSTTFHGRSIYEYTIEEDGSSCGSVFNSVLEEFEHK